MVGGYTIVRVLAVSSRTDKGHTADLSNVPTDVDRAW